MGTGAGANMTPMADQLDSAPESTATPRRGKGMSLDVFMPENELSRMRAEARKRAVKRWFNRLLKRSPQPN
jgi:hypothetical protein